MTLGWVILIKTKWVQIFRPFHDYLVRNWKSTSCVFALRWTSVPVGLLELQTTQTGHWWLGSGFGGGHPQWAPFLLLTVTTVAAFLQLWKQFWFFVWVKFWSISSLWPSFKALILYNSFFTTTTAKVIFHMHHQFDHQAGALLLNQLDVTSTVASSCWSISFLHSNFTFESWCF